MEYRVSTPITSNTGIDELTVSSAGVKFSKAKLDPREGLEGVRAGQGASIAEESQQAFIEPADYVTEAEPELELEQDLRNTDEFTPYNPKRDKDKEKNKDERRRKDRRIGKLKRANSVDDEDYDEEDVFNFLGFLDKLWQRLTELVEDVAEEFDNWNKWFKKEKAKPPVPDKSRVTYVRDEYHANRSPHLWKSDPDRSWILAFGHNKINNVVSSVLYKYQNETISKDA